jgi:hypothetical protein
MGGGQGRLTRNDGAPRERFDWHRPSQNVPAQGRVRRDLPSISRILPAS